MIYGYQGLGWRSNVMAIKPKHCLRKNRWWSLVMAIKNKLHRIDCKQTAMPVHSYALYFGDELYTNPLTLYVAKRRLSTGYEPSTKTCLPGGHAWSNFQINIGLNPIFGVFNEYHFQMTLFYASLVLKTNVTIKTTRKMLNFSRFGDVKWFVLEIYIV